MTQDISKEREEVLKKVLREALKEWLDEKFAAFGRWSLLSLGALALAAMVYFILISQGWHK